MAIDTPTKRASALNFGLPFNRALPVPDGTVGQADRQHVLGMYGGILATGGAALILLLLLYAADLLGVSE